MTILYRSILLSFHPWQTSLGFPCFLKPDVSWANVSGCFFSLNRITKTGRLHWRKRLPSRRDFRLWTFFLMYFTCHYSSLVQFTHSTDFTKRYETLKVVRGIFLERLFLLQNSQCELEKDISYLISVISDVCTHKTMDQKYNSVFSQRHCTRNILDFVYGGLVTLFLLLFHTTSSYCNEVCNFHPKV